MQPLTIYVQDYGPVCLGNDRGNKMFSRISNELMNDREIVLDFTGVERMSAAFLNESVGQLYRIFSKEFLKQKMKPPINARNGQLHLLKMVTDNAKHSYRKKNRER